jgi:pimeloyl-ACP methyl ester carboxylesterase
VLNAEHDFFIDGPAGKLRVSDGGSGGVPVLFLHGLGGDSGVWQAQLDHLRQTRRAVAFDARGHGRSARAPESAYTVEGLADDIFAVAQALRLSRFVLVGHSISGCALQAYAARHGETLAGLVFADAIGDFRKAGAPSEIEQFIQADLALNADPAKEAALFSEMLTAPAKDATKTQVLRALGQLDPKAFAPLRISMARFAPAQDLSQSGVPLFSIEAADNNFPVRFSALEPAAPRVALAHVSHWLMLDDPGGFNAALDGFLALADSGPAKPASPKKLPNQ